MRLANKVALITGGASGIGRATALLFSAEGASVMAVDLDDEGGGETVRMIESQGGTASDRHADVSVASDCETMVREAERRYERLDILFNNAGIMHPDDQDAVQTEEAVWDQTMSVNLKGVFLGCKYGIPALRRAGGGSIVNTASFVAIMGAATPQLAYTASKGGVLAMTRELAMIHARENIRVNALCPGPLRTELLMKALDTDEKKQRRLVHIPLGRFGEAAEIARAVLFLASDDSSFVTGSTFVVDGGITGGVRDTGVTTVPLEVLNPYDATVVCRLEDDEGDGLAAKVAAAGTAFARWRRVPLPDRIRQVETGLERLRASAESVAADVTRQMGKPLAQARREFETVFERAEHMIAIAPDSLAPDFLPEAPGLHRRIEHAPLGVVLNLAAWNYPLVIPINVVVPALLAGNTVLLKHSATTPLCARAFEEAFGALDVPNLVTSLVLTHDRTAELIADPRVAHVAFTGSVDGGHAIYREAARRFIDAGLELGGKDPAYVAQDADLEFAVANTVDGACYNAGQSCCAVERVYVHRTRIDEYLDRAREALDAYRLGDPMDDATTLGPLAQASAIERLDAQIADARTRGARLLTGGSRPADLAGHFFQPTLLTDVPNDAAVMQEESFGPVLPVMAVNDDEQAVAMMQDTRYGLTASVWTADRDRAERFARSLDAGTVFQNRCDYLDPALPWTGARDSGKGSTLSRYGFHHLTRLKSIHFRTVT